MSRPKAPEDLHAVKKSLDPKIPSMLGLTGLETAALATVEEHQETGWWPIPSFRWFPSDLRYAELRLSLDGNRFRLTPLGRFVVKALHRFRRKK